MKTLNKEALREKLLNTRITCAILILACVYYLFLYGVAKYNLSILQWQFDKLTELTKYIINQ